MNSDTQNVIVKSNFCSKNNLRFFLERIWNEELNKALFILMNPSKATTLKLDNTLCNIVNYSIDNNYGSLRLVNLFPTMATNPKDLSGKLKIGQVENNQEIIESIKWADRIFIAWGTDDKKYITRKKEVEEILQKNNVDNKDIFCWKDKDNKFPKHLRIMSDDWTLAKYNYKFLDKKLEK